MKYLLVFCLLFFVVSSCAHPMYEAREQTNTTFSREYKTDPNGAYAALRWALKTSGYSITNEDLQNGVVTSGWRPTTIDSHYLAPFGHPDYGVNGAYYKLDVKIVGDGTVNTRVLVASHVKSMMAHLKSSGREETKVLDMVGNYLRKPDIRITNLGMEE